MHKILGLDITVMGSAAIAPVDDKTFDLRIVGLKHFSPLNLKNSTTYTVVGDDVDGPDVEIFVGDPRLSGGEIILDTLTMPQGSGVRLVPSPMLQASIGAAFTKLSAVADLEVVPNPDLPPTGTNCDNQIVGFDASSYTINIIVSKTFKPLTFFTSLGYESADVNIDLKGNYPVTIVDDDSDSPSYGELVTVD